MKPIRLELQGFTSFRDKVAIDFSEFDLFAITGPTGAGKTSLIDAIVYALYGMTPRVGNNVAELISQGAKRTEVLLEFQAGPQRYRIGRTMRRGRSTVQSNRRLEKLLGDGQWEPLSDLERETRQWIQQIIGLDFNGFTKSVVLPQGEFDRFLKGDPADRRKILTDLLQLRIYEEMGRRARDRSKDAAARASTLKGQLESNFGDATESNRKALKSELAEAKRVQKRLGDALDAIDAALPTAREVRQKRLDRDRADGQLKTVDSRLAKVRATHQENSGKLQKRRDELASLGEAIEKVGYDSGRHLALSALQPKADRLQKLQQDLADHRKRQRELEQRRGASQKSIDRIQKQTDEATRLRSEAEQRLREAESARDQALQKHGPLESIQLMIGELPQRARRLSRIDDLAKRLENQNREMQEARERIDRLAVQAEAAQDALLQARGELAELQLRHAAAHLRPHLEAGQPCPVCLQEVSQLPPEEEHPALAAAEEALRRREADAERLHAELAQSKARFEAMPGKRRLLEEGLADARQQEEGLDRRIEEALGKPTGADPSPGLRKLAKELENLANQALSRRKAFEEAAAAENAIVTAAASARHELGLLERDAAAAEAAMEKDLGESRQLAAELADWPDPGELRDQLKAFETAHREKLRLEKLRDQARTDVESTLKMFQEAEKEIHLLEADRQRHSDSRAQSEAALAELEASLAKLFPDCASDGKSDELDQLSSRRRDLETERSKTADQIARGEEKLSHLIERIRLAEQMREQAKGLESDAAIARELGLALSAGRFITFIQEEALARLAEGATRHLLSLSADRYSFSVSNGNFFVLDHWNADESRPVTTLSGGESFLASLSLALSLAESLAEFCSDRERFSLESLFLDEGFSTLDPETLDVVFQGIETLAAGDRMIGAVSHISELAERFPTRIHVRKSVGGSTVEVG